MTTMLINKPAANTTVSYDIAAGDRIAFKALLKNVKMNMVGSDMVLYWPDGGKVVLVGAGLSMFNAEDTTLFEMADGKVMTGNDMLAQMGKQETVLASEIDKISAVFEKKDQDTTADSKEIQQLKSLIKEKSATPSFKAIDEVLNPTDALNPLANQNKLQDAMRKADETFRRVQDEDNFHGRYTMVSSPPINPIEPGLPPPEPAKPEYFSTFVRHVLLNNNYGGSGNLGTTAALRFRPEDLTGSGTIYGDDPDKFTATKMEQVLTFRVNDLADFEKGLRQSGLLKGSLDTYKFTMEIPGGLPDGIELTYNNGTSITPINGVYTILMGGNTNLDIGVKYQKAAFFDGNSFKAVMKAYFVDSAVSLPETGEPTSYAFVYETSEGKGGETFRFVDPTKQDATQSIFNSAFALPLSPVGTNITGSEFTNDTIIPGIGQSGTTAVTLDGKGGRDIVDYKQMFEQKGGSHAPLEITMTSGLNSQVRMTVNGNKFLHSNLKNIETIIGGDGDDTLYGRMGTGFYTEFQFDGGDGLDTLDMSKTSGSGQWVGVDFRSTNTSISWAHKNIERYVGSPNNYDFVTMGTGLDTSKVTPTIDGGTGGWNRISWSGLDGALSSRGLYWDIRTVDSDGYSMAWLYSIPTPSAPPIPSASGISYKIKNFSSLYGTPNADTVFLSPITTTIFIAAGSGDSVIGHTTSKGSLSFNSAVTLTFAGADVTTGSNHYATETRAYSITGTNVKYQNINNLGFGGQTININLSNANPTQGYSASTVAVPVIADESSSGTLTMSGMGGANGVAFVAGSYFSSTDGDLGRSMSLPSLNSGLLSLSTTAKFVTVPSGSISFASGLNLTAHSMNTVIGTNNADVLVAGFNTTTINAGLGNDILYSIDSVRYPSSKVMYDDDTGDGYSMSGGDTLNGQGGDDVFFRIVDAFRSSKTAFRDVIDGGDGTDTLVLAPSKTSAGTALNTASEDTIRQSAVLGTDAPVRSFFASTSFGGNLASVASNPDGTLGATLASIQNVMVGGGGFVADDKNAANQYWFAGTQANTAKTAAAMLFNDNNANETDIVTVYGGNLLVYFDGLGAANINQALFSSRTDSIGSQTFSVGSGPRINPLTGLSDTLGTGQISLFALGDVGHANGRSVTVNLQNSTNANVGGTIQYSGGGGVNTIWRPAGGQDDDIYAIYTTALGDSITGDAFGNIVFTGSGTDTVNTADGNDTVYAAGGEATTLNLGNGTDILEAAFFKTSLPLTLITNNTSSVNGGAGTDSLQFGLKSTQWNSSSTSRQVLGVDWNTDGVDLTLSSASGGSVGSPASVGGTATGTNLLGTGNTINFSGFETFHLTNGADTVTVNDAVMTGLTSSNIIDASPLRAGGIYASGNSIGGGYSPAGYNSANSNEKFTTSANEPIFDKANYANSTGVDTIKYTGDVGVDAIDFVNKGFKSFEKIDLKDLSLSSTNASFDVKVSDILNLSESRTLIIDRNNSFSINVKDVALEGWSSSNNNFTTTSGAQTYIFSKSGFDTVTLAITG